MQLSTLGNATTTQKQADTLLIKTPEAEARIMIYSPTIVRVCISKNFDSADKSFAVIQKPDALHEYNEAENAIELKTSALTVRIQKSPLRFSFFTADDKLLGEDD